MQRFFALTTRGLEDVSARECGAHESVVVSAVAYRRVSGYWVGSPAPLLELRTVDDVFLEAAQWLEVRHTRDMLSQFHQWSHDLGLHPIAATCASLRPIRRTPSFSVTASFVGRRNYSANEIKTAVAEGVRSGYDWDYVEDDRAADFNIRVFIEHETALVGVRLGKAPLHERPYKHAQRPGSLKPPVAAAMLQIANLVGGETLLDPCCGVGTILIEATESGASTFGGDIESEALTAARVNTGTHVTLVQWDGRKLPLAGSSIARVATNLPWGGQVKVYAGLSELYGGICSEVSRVLAPGGRAVVLTASPELLTFPDLFHEQSIEISLFGQRPTIAVFAATRRTTHLHSAPDAPAR
jgi:23S rRNA G2445 N2-methylase RlmL